MCYKFLACESKMASIFSGQLSGLPTELPTISIIESSGLPTELHTELPTISVYGSSGQPYLHGKIPKGSPLHCPLSCPLFSHLEVGGCPLSCPLFLYMEVVGSLICMAKFPWEAHGQPTSLPTCSTWAAKWAAPLFFPYGLLPSRLIWLLFYKDKNNFCRIFHLTIFCQIGFIKIRIVSYIKKSVYYLS